MIIAFDFDGTLADTYSCIEDAFKRALEKRYRWLPGKALWAKLLTKIEFQFERPTFGKHKGKIKSPFFMRTKFFETWFEERAKLSKPIDDAPELLKKLKEQGHTVISFSAEDFIDGMKVKRLKAMGIYDLFDDVIVFGRDLTIEEAFKLVREKYGDDIFIWVDDKPWRFIGHGDENTEYVWYYFPITAKFVEKKREMLALIPHLHVIRDLWSLFDVIKNVERQRRSAKEKA
ncbi:hydrolase, HAD superfamily [Thermococcus kodakarensis KOD1]|uniref:Hydrolase, HAD superfamily n=1 Tax=Thermococcus kodakarensis (strain ATCC BAA-918 / JCM 12380 / KOD1) TaxID=69014 RepID=Q5JH07_THEKO|nr:HAD hydrolase-like protein [Thermococcus kodakarensis]WCN27360.1 HAD hydrolase-like protein [Thermococcus kodakarensis]WCN29649.1 HAD hydrolase-like protein [Thermococcus kodakarensis]BAD85572.1 hydrolase, HAD superfamily [Thermococcus kodakarensis KOD1]